MALPPGTRIGVYDVTDQIGAGGMGEVYRATDSNLKRSVAIKVLPASMAGDADRLARFQREAEVLAALNHPNIAAIYGLEKTPDLTALVMELVEGEDLSHRIARGAMPIDEALPIAKQIADALEAAHEQGIIHRDLKPANIKVRSDGTVKVLDFGLAKAMDPAAASSADAMNSPTLSLHATQAGMILGTAAYMAPEQAKGKSVDKRADIWAFGAVLYEMLTGARAFAGEDVSDTLAHVLMKDPDWRALPATVPPAVKTVLQRCLQKDRKQRMRDIGDVALALDGAFATADVTATAPRHSRIAWFIAAAASLVAASLVLPAFRHVRETPPDLQIVKTTILPPDGAEFSTTTPFALSAISPDGSRIVFGARANGKTQLYLRRLDASVAQPLPGTEDPAQPFWSADSRWIAFGQGNKLKKIDSQGGPPVTITDLAAALRGGSWNRDGVILFAINASGPIQRVSAGGGTAVPASPPNQLISYRNPWFLPDGRHFLYASSVNGDIPVLVGSLDEPSQPGKVVAQASSVAVSYAEGRLIYLRENTLMAHPFDLNRLETTGEARPIAEGIPTFTNPSRLAGFTISQNGFLITMQGGGTGQSSLVWKDRRGQTLGRLGEATGAIGNVVASPDWKSVVASIADRSGPDDLWVFDLARGLPTRFTFDPLNDRSPTWTPDGKTIYFRSNRRGPLNVFRKPANGAGTEELVFADDASLSEGTISPDGTLMIVENRGLRSSDISILSLTGANAGQKTALRPFLNSPFIEFSPRFSPDGRWVAYGSDESGRLEVYVTPFPGAGSKWQVSNGGGEMPVWRRDGKELFYVNADGQLMAAEITIGNDAPKVGRMQRLFDGIVTLRGMTYDVSADGQKFLVVDDEIRGNRPLTLIQNWTAALKK